jgi:Fic family protein
MIINHQSAIRYVYDNRESFIKPDTKLTKNIHSLLVNGLGVSSTVRDRGVGISGSVYRPLASKKEIQSELERALMNINSKQNIWSKTLAMVLSISYIQPFEDGNKRTARVMANGLLYADNNIPLVFGNIDPTLYRRACIAFYELGNASIMKNILLDSWRETISELNNN